MRFRFVPPQKRRGNTLEQYLVVAALIVVVVVGSVMYIGRESKTRMQGTSGAIADPARLKDMMK